MIPLINSLTPVEQYSGVLYKRDDLFAPYGAGQLNGGKVRQAMQLLQPLESTIRSKYRGVVTHTQVHSTTGTIVAKLCHSMRIPCVVCIGGSTPSTLDNHHMMRLAKHYGADIRNVCGTGMHGPVQARMRELMGRENLFDAVFSHNIEAYQGAILDSTTNQVENIPNELDQLVMPVGSGIHFAAMIRGLHRYGKRVKRVIGLCVGPERSKNINAWINPLEYPAYPYELHCLNTVYGKPLDKMFGGGMLDQLYEAKAHAWMDENLDTKNNSTLFWVVGRRPTERETDITIGA